MIELPNDNTLAGLSFSGGDLVGAGLAAASMLHGSGQHQPECTPPGGCFQCQMHGSGSIAGCIDNANAGWIAAAQARDAGQIDNATLLAVTEQVLAGLSNEQLFTPQSDAYLTQAKQIFTQRANDIRSRMTTTNGTQSNGTTTTGGTPAAGDTIAGISTTTLLLVAGLGLVAFSLMRAE